MALSFSVFNKFKAIDGITTPVKKMEKSTKKFGRTATRSFKNADRAASKFSSVLKGLFVGAAIVGGIALLNQGIRTVTTSFIQFDDSIFAAGARFKDIGPDVENFTESIKGIKKAAREAGSTTEFTATQAAQALDFLARAGFSSTEAIGSLNSMINLATSSGEDFARVADISSDLLGAFGLNAENTAQKIKNLNRLNDVLVKTVNSANVTVEDMFETMKQVGPIATGILGSSLEEVAAITAVLGSSGIKGSEAMTALKNAYLRLAAPTSEAKKLMKALNLQLDDGKGGARKLTDVMEDLKSRISGLGKIQQAEVLDILFGKRAIAGGKIIIDNIAKVREFEKAILKSGGASQRTADVIRQSLGNRLKALGSALTEFGFKFLEAFEVRGKDVISGFTEVVRGIDVKPMISLLNSFIKFVSVNKEFIPIISSVIAFFATWKLGIIAVNIVIATMNALMAANPIGLIVIGIAAAIIGIKVLVRHHDKMNAAFSKGLSNIKQQFIDLGEFVGKIFFGIGQKIGDMFTNIGQKIGGIGLGIGTKINRFLGFGGDDQQSNNIPVSPNAGIIENRSRVDVNLNNVPAGSTVKQSGGVKGFNLNMGFSGAG